eukprot:TRINITY_DN850_c0_g1_i1.p1 TRINITY_DN850_c0_g1~~TRINITY_DN850_c0_g1_i1.p1  ORF type:complete len:218 (-),score=38.34 TRINITY_DN850_c0_g1_i1:92-745(-)
MAAARIATFALLTLRIKGDNCMGSNCQAEITDDIALLSAKIKKHKEEQDPSSNRANEEDPARWCLTTAAYYVEPSGAFTLSGTEKTEEMDWKACQKRCDNTDDCAHFSFWPDGGCHLTSSESTLKKNTNPKYSALLSGPASADCTSMMACELEGRTSQAELCNWAGLPCTDLSNEMKKRTGKNNQYFCNKDLLEPGGGCCRPLVDDDKSMPAAEYGS